MLPSFSRREFNLLMASVFLPQIQDKDLDVFAGYDRTGMGEDILLDPTKPFRSEVGQPGWRGEATSDLVERARMALVGTLTNHVWPDGVPCFDLPINYATGQAGMAREPGMWDRISQTGRSVDAILCAREMTGDWNSGTVNETGIRKILIGDFRDDGFNYDQNGVAMMHDQNRALLGLATWYRFAAGEKERRMLRDRGHALVAAFARTANKQGDAWGMPGMYYSPDKGFYSIARAPGTHGRTIMPLIQYARTTGCEEAISLAEHYANHVLNVSDSFRFDKTGKFAGFGDESLHVHSVVATVAGLILLGNELKRNELVERGRSIYENGVKTMGNEFGWIPEANPDAPVNRANRKLRQTTCEGCCIADCIEAAIYLAQNGHPQQWAEAERYLRNHLMESQMTNVSWVKNAGDVDMKPRVLGGFSARSSPNRLFDLFHLSGLIGCCNAAGVRALYLAWLHGTRQDHRGVWVNLLFDRDTPYVTVKSELPRQGRLHITMKTDADLYLRIPEWGRDAIRFEPGSLATRTAWSGPFRQIRELKKGETVVAEFPLARSQREWFHSIMGITYKTDWLGDTIVSISPPGNCFPLYERKYLLT
jgi:hypothetical protein